MARIHEHTVNIAAPLTLVSAIPLAMQGDAEADELRLHVVDGRESADMKGYTVGGYLERADGVRVMLKGSVTADMVEVKLQEACYRVPGAYKAFVRLTKTTGEKMTLFLFAGRIESEGDGEIVDEEDTLPSVEELIAMIEEIDRAIAGANTARDGANAAATRADAAAAEALKAAENAGRAEKAANDAAYEANAAADAADEAAVGASAWAKATMEAETLPEGSKPTISVEKNVNGGNVIRVGIPAGKTGNTGETGATPQITFEVETGAAGSDVKVEQSGTAEAPHIKLTIPRGDTGAVEGVDYYEGDPAPLGTASPGTSNGLARGNHVHPMPSADDVGARPDDWMPTAAEVGALPSDGTAVNANALNGKSAEHYATTEQLNNKQVTGLVSSSTDIYVRNEPMYPGMDLYGTDQEGNKSLQGSIRLSMNTDHDGYREIELLDRNSSKVCLILTSEYGTAVNSAMLGSKEPKYYIQPRNLLDNSWWKVKKEIVNQRGQTIYTGDGYTIDRWIIWGVNGDASLTVNDSGLTFNPGSGGGTLSQKIPLGILESAKTYTLAVHKSNGETEVRTDGVTFNYNGECDLVTVLGVAETILWAALYEGEYTADNLPPYVPKGYAAELAECMRYAVDVENAVLSGVVTENGVCEAFLPLNVSMRKDANPTVTIKNALVAYTADGNNHALTFTQALVRNTGLLLTFSCGSTINAAVNIPTFNAFISVDL